MGTSIYAVFGRGSCAMKLSPNLIDRVIACEVYKPYGLNYVSY